MDKQHIIRRHAEAVFAARDHYAGAKSLVDDAYHEWLEMTAILHTAAEKAKAEVVEAETCLREMALTIYRDTEDKHPGPGVEIKQRVRLLYDPGEALAWAVEHGLALSLDVKAFERHAKAGPIGFVEYRNEAMAALAQDMAKALE